MTIDDSDTPPPYRNRIAILPGDPPIAYRPRRLLVDQDALDVLQTFESFDRERYEPEPVFAATDDDGQLIGEVPPFGQWYRIDGVPDASGLADEFWAAGFNVELDVVYFANDADCCGCPPHPAMAAQIAEEGWGANPWRANPWRANPWRANSWTANPWRANAEELNVVATGKPPTSSVMPALFPTLPTRPAATSSGVVIGVLDSGLAGGWDNKDGYRPELFGADPASMRRISGPPDLPSQSMGGHPADNYLDPVAGHGTFIAGIIEQLTPGCEIRVERVFEPQGDVGTFELAFRLWYLMETVKPQIVNFSFGGTGRGVLFELLIDYYHELYDVVFVAAAGNEGSCVAQYPAALASVVGVAGLGPTGPAEWSNYGPWVDACAPGTDIVSSFFAKFNGALPRINGIDSDDFDQWATWSGTSFAAPVVVAALAREMVTTGCSAAEAVEWVVRAPHLARLPNMGTIVNF
ncbi:MAG TPA: S8/S53 family peptidase [Ilumatobacteraceae bacterium]|nr:S8/S53 family peptidase [Ilumatobacteraceae bacterium]